MQGFRAVLLCAAALAATCTYADEFSWQLNAGARNSDVGRSADTDGATLTATYYFGSVDDSMGPYALAAFLNRSSRIGASYNEDKTTVVSPVLVIGPPGVPLPPLPETVRVTDRGAGRSLSGRYVRRDSGWYVGASLAAADVAQPAPLPSSFSVFGDDISSGSLLFGKYVAASTAVELSLEASEATSTSELPLFCTLDQCAFVPISRLRLTEDADSKNLGIAVQHVGRVGKLAYSLSGGVTSHDIDVTFDLDQIPVEPPPLPLFPASPAPGGVYQAVPPLRPPFHARARRYAVAGEFFPTRALGFRVGYAHWDGDSTLDQSYDLGATWFFRRDFGARVTFSRTRTDLPITTVEDDDTVALQLIGRL